MPSACRPAVRGAALAWAFAAALALAPGRAASDGVSAHLEPGYVNEQLDTTDQAGRTTHRSSEGFTQSYQLLVDKDLLSQLKLSVGGSLQKLTSWTRTEEAGTERTDDTTDDVFARLLFGTPTLRLGGGVERHERDSAFTGKLTTDRLSISGGWRPVDLPELDVQLSRTRDRGGVPETSVTTDAALVGVRYTLDRLELRYLFGYADRDDVVSGTESRSVDQTAQATWAGVLFDGRSNLYASTTVSNRQLSTVVTGPGGTVERQAFPVAGLSLIEVPPARPELDTLVSNPALIDGDQGTSAAVNLGFGPVLSGDQSARDLGAQFADAITTVDTVLVWVDRFLPPEVVAAFTWTAYQSDDDRSWTPVAVTRVAFGQARPRFEITIAATRARYLKVVTSPLPAGATTDRRFSDVFVTEVQFSNVVLATSLPRSQSSTTAALNATMRTIIVRGTPEIAHDATVQLSRISFPGLTTYAVLNGLSYHQRLSRTVTFDARAAHRDQDTGSGHEGQDEWSASLVARPLPTLFDSLSYSGTYNEKSGNLSNSLSFYNRGDLYAGVSAQVNLGASLGTLRDGQANASALSNVTLSLVPNRVVTLSGGWLYTTTRTFGGDVPSTRSDFERVDATAAVTPTAALSGSVSVSRVIRGVRPTTLASLQASYAPFHGDLQLSVAFARTLDTAADATTQLVSPSLRWNVRRNVYLNASYSVLDVSAPAQTTRSRVFSTSVVLYL